MKYIQAKIRLKEPTNLVLLDYCEFSEMKRSHVIDKALQKFFKQDLDFAKEYNLKNEAQHNIISVSELEDMIFNRYKIMIYIHAEQDERIGIKLEYWPKCMGRYTVKEFKEKILRRCLAKDVGIDIFDLESKIYSPRQTIKKLKDNYPKTPTLNDYYDVWGDFSPPQEN